MDWLKKYENGGNLQEYLVNNKKVSTKQGNALDSLSTRLRDLQHLQTIDFQSSFPDIPIQKILKNEELDKKFKNRNLPNKADSLISIYGDKSIPVNKEYSNTLKEYNDIVTQLGTPPQIFGTKEKGMENFGWRNLLYKYGNNKSTPAYKLLEQEENGGELNYNNNNVKIPPNFVGMGNNIQGRNYSPAWGGQFEGGGELQKLDQLTNFNNFGQNKHWLNKYLSYER